MRARIQTRQQIIHFRRWSRKGYAVFASLGRCVSIRQLKKGLIEASLKMQKTFLVPFFQEIKEGDQNGYEEEEMNGMPSLSRLLLLFAPFQTLTEVNSKDRIEISVYNKPDGCTLVLSIRLFVST